MIVLCWLGILSMVDGFYLYFDRSSYDLLVLESTPIYSSLGIVRAIASPTLTVKYELHGDTNGTFHLNSSTGELILFNSLDYENIPIYHFTVEAHGSLVISSCLTELSIHLLNVNDHQPEMNLIFYPPEISDRIPYDLRRSSAPIATIHVKDLDESTKNLSLSLNDDEHFRIEFLRQLKTDFFTESIFLLSTRNHHRWLNHDYFYDVEFQACDHDEPNLCRQRSYRFHLISMDYLCYLSFNQTSLIIDIQEDSSVGTLIYSITKTNHCDNVVLSLTDRERFSFNGDFTEIFTRKKFNRHEQSIYHLQLLIHHSFRINFTVRLLDSAGHRPFLMRKTWRIPHQDFEQLQLHTSSVCRSQWKMDEYFQLLSNCTIRSLVVPPPAGRHYFRIQLNQSIDYEDTFQLELVEDRSVNWIVVFIIVGLSIVLLIISLLFIFKLKRLNVNSLRPSLNVYEDRPQPAMAFYLIGKAVTSIYDIPRPSSPVISSTV